MSPSTAPTSTGARGSTAESDERASTAPELSTRASSWAQPNHAAWAVYRHRLYWVNQAPTGSIGRANLRGPLDVHENFVPSEQGSSQGDLEEPCGVAVDSTGIYWTDRVGGAVGHANLDGTGGRTLIAGGYATACGIALSSPYIYFAHSPYTGAGSIARALKSGDRVDPAFITGLNGPCGAALYGHDLYFADGATIDRTDLASPDPTSATAQIILGTKDACGVAVDGLFAGRIRVLAHRSGSGGTERLTITVSNPGTIRVTPLGAAARRLRPLHATVHRAGRATLILRPISAAGQQRAPSRGHIARLRLQYTPNGGITTINAVTLPLPT